MADIFISYAREDQERIGQLAAALEADGFTVWWDRHIQGGEEFSARIEREIAAAALVLVCWSASASGSRWVRDEANVAAEAAKLIAITLDGSLPPIGFRQFHAVDFSGWKGQVPDAPYPDLSAALHARREGRVVAAGNHATPAATKPVRISVVAAGVAAIAALALAAVMFSAQRPSAPQAADDAPAEGRRDAGDAKASAPAPGIDARSVAVLPFVAFSADDPDSYFADGLTEEVIHLLARSPQLNVAGRTSSFAFKGRNIDLREVGRQLGVAHLIEGSVRKSGDRVRVTAQMIRASDGFHLWSESYDRTVVDVLAVQEDIARQIAARLGTPLAAPAGSHIKNRTADPEAYDSYLRGLSLFRNRTDVAKAAEAFEHAVERDAKFAAAWAALADAYLSVPYWVPAIMEQAAQVAVYQAKAERAAETAVALNPSIAETHHALALVMRAKWRWTASEDALVDALALEPRGAWLLEDHQEHYEMVGRYPEALKAIELARKIEPLNPFYLAIAGISHWHLHEYDSAIASMKSALDGNPQLARFGIEYAALLADAGRSTDAILFLRSCPNCEPGARQRALDILEGRGAAYLDKTSAAFGDLVFNKLAGGDDAVLNWLEARAEEGSVPPVYSNSQAVIGVRNTERYRRLVERVGFDDYWRARGWPSYCRPAGENDFVCSGA